jgi:hypothetical protein
MVIAITLFSSYLEVKITLSFGRMVPEFSDTTTLKASTACYGNSFGFFFLLFTLSIQ